MILIALIFQISDVTRSMHVGGHLPNEDPFANTRFEADSISVAFSIQLDSNGLFQSVTVPGGIPVFLKNLVRGWANQLQVNAGKITQQGLPSAFKSAEVIEISKSLFRTARPFVRWSQNINFAQSTNVTYKSNLGSQTPHPGLTPQRDPGEVRGSFR